MTARRSGWLDDDRRLRVALTGGVASGKSTVAAAFARLGVPVVDADQVGRDVTAPGSAAAQAVIERFGEGVRAAAGGIDRAALRARIFADADARAALEALLHPAILGRMAALGRAATGPYLMFVVPLLVERDLADRFDRVLVVDCAPELQSARLVARDGETPAGALRMLAAQASRQQRRAVADDLVENDGSLAALEAKVAALHETYVTLAERAPFPAARPRGENGPP